MFRSLRKTLLARLQSRTPSCQALSWRCPLLLFCLFFFTIYCSTAVALPFYPMQLFFYFAIVEEVIFSRRSKINNLVLFDDDFTSFSSFSSPPVLQLSNLALPQNNAQNLGINLFCSSQVCHEPTAVNNT